jgi:hypothetical protein
MVRIFYLGKMELSNYVLTKENYAFYFKVVTKKTIEVYGDVDDKLICPHVFKFFKIYLDKNINKWDE